jgi:hypothetical protein
MTNPMIKEAEMAVPFRLSPSSFWSGNEHFNEMKTGFWWVT